MVAQSYGSGVTATFVEECEQNDWDAPEWRPLRELEAAYLAGLRAWDARNLETGEWCERTDKFERRASGLEPRVRKMHEAKSLTNQAVAAAGGEAARQVRGKAGMREAAALVLDGAEAATASALVAEGFPRGRLLVPNTVPSVAEALRRKGFRAWAGWVQDYLKAPVLRPLDLVYLDHTGAFPRRAGQIRALFENGIVGPGSVVACTFSTREGPWQEADPAAVGLPRGWSRAHAVYAVLHVLLSSAHAHGLSLQGLDLDGMADYTYRGPSSGGLHSLKRLASRDNAAHETCAGDSMVSQPPRDAVFEQNLLALLQEGDLAGLAITLAAWASQEGAPAVTPQNELGCLAHQAALVTGRVLPALGPNGEPLLGVAWSPRPRDARSIRHRGKPLAALGSNGAVQDADVARLRSVAARVSSVLGSQSGGAAQPPEPAALDRVPHGNLTALTLRGCLLLYPEQMMFLVLKVCASREGRADRGVPLRDAAQK